MSSGSDSDEEFVPGKPEELSEEDSADDETDLQFEQELEQKAKKRKAAPEKIENNKRKTRNSDKTEVRTERRKLSEEEKATEQLDHEGEKKREEDLWAKFLDGTDSKPKPRETTMTTKSEIQLDNKKIHEVTSTAPKQNKEDEKAREKRIFEFAGETIVVENNIIKEKINTDSPTSVMNQGPSRSRGGGLSDLLGQINKKNTLSTLEKSKLDWNTFKIAEGIEEEVQSHNKGKAGYLDRQDFLERADLRQYELERDLRMSKRSNR